MVTVIEDRLPLGSVMVADGAMYTAEPPIEEVV